MAGFLNETVTASKNFERGKSEDQKVIQPLPTKSIILYSNGEYVHIKATFTL